MSIQTILNDKGGDVIAISAKKTVKQAVDMMNNHHIGALVVADDGTGMVGIFTERDVIRALTDRGARILEQPVAKHMTERPASVSPETSVNEAMTMMTEKKFRHLPVMQNDTLCGLISIGDLVNYKIHQTEKEAQAMREYISS